MKLLQIIAVLPALSLLYSSLSLAAPAPAGSKDNSGTAPVEQAVGDPRSIELNEQGIAAMTGKNTAKAEELFKKALAADSKNVTAAFNLGGALIANNKTGEAIGLLDEYTKQYDQDPGMFVRLGDAHFSNKDVKKATQAYERAFALAPDYPGLAFKLGTIYGLANRSADAEKMFEVACEQDPKNGQALANLSSLFLANGKPDKAIGTARKALQVKATKDVYVTLGTAYEIQRDYSNALIAFQRAVDLGDAREELQRKIEGLKKAVR